MTFERASLFSSKKEFLSFLILSLFILSYSLLINFQEYKNLTRFDSALINATVIKQYIKTKDSKTFQILKLKTNNKTTIYTSTKKSSPLMIGKDISLEIWAENISFYEYLTSFYVYSKLLHVENTPNLKQTLNLHISSLHKDKYIANIYQALYTATPLNKELQSAFSSLGVSHLLAISGFHLSVLSAILFLIFRPIYKFFQNRYFPYRNSKSDLFIFVTIFLLSYLIFLSFPPSLLRAFAMLIIGFSLYDRGIKIISMQTLLITIILLLSLFPKLFFALGFWLSIAGVFYILLFLIHFKTLPKIWLFIIVPFWVYLMMLPYSLVIFSSFSIYHPLSIFWTTLFTLFYPLSIVLHVVGFGDIFDTVLVGFISLSQDSISLHVEYIYLIFEVALSLFSVFYRRFIWVLISFNIFILIYAIYHVT